jgi:hypothetical protein
MLEKLKIICQKQYYLKDGTCLLFESDKKEKKICLKMNCIYFKGENKNV